MVITRLKGGLGNQLFQYAAAKGCLRKNENLYLDLRFLRENNRCTNAFTARNFELDIFPNLDAKIPNDFFLKLYDDESKTSKRLKKIGLINYSTISQIENELVSFSERSKNTYLDGYFQSEKYFRDAREGLLHNLAFPKLDEKNQKIQTEINGSENSLSIHIRRGDYVSNIDTTKYHGVLPLSYYINAFSVLNNSYQNLSVYIFTDDVNWAKENFLLEGTKLNFIEGNYGFDSWKDMALMSCCKHHIIANSSFSWWGAWLSTKNGQTFAPRNWFASHVDYNINNIIPTHWIIIE